jgi:tetratricopeptide (TPR) repeat protein
MERKRLLDHPEPERLRRFASGGLPAGESDAVVMHLMRGCSRCQAQIEPHLRSALAPADPPDPLAVAGQAQLDGYDRAVEAALASVLLHGTAAIEVRKRTRELLAELRGGGSLPPPPGPAAPPARTGQSAGAAPATPPGPARSRPPLDPRGAGLAALRSREARMFPCFDAALVYSWELRQDDPRRMIELARYAVALAPRLGEDGYAPDQVADFQARAWAELANAYRVGEEPSRAEEAIATAFENLAHGTGDELLMARVLSLQASILGGASRFRAALEALSRVQAIHLRRGDRHNAGRALIKAAYHLGCAGLLELALHTVEEGMAMIDGEIDPGLYTNALHNRLELLVYCGRFHEARAELRKHRSRLLSDQGLLYRLRLKGIEGRLEAGLGNLERAERAAMTAYRRSRKAGSRRLTAVFELDLAAVRIRQGRIGEARPLIESAVGTLRELGAPAELFAVLQTGRELVAATAAQVQLTADLLRFPGRFGRAPRSDRPDRSDRSDRPER